MKYALIYGVFICLLCIGCAPVAVIRNDRPNWPHDNGKHKGWYKHGRHAGLPPGQAKKRGYGWLPPGQAKKQRW